MENEFAWEYLEPRELDKVVESGEMVRVIFNNGYQIDAVIEAHDADVMLLQVKGKKWLVYKQNVSTVILN